MPVRRRADDSCRHSAEDASGDSDRETDEENFRFGTGVISERDVDQQHAAHAREQAGSGGDDAGWDGNGPAAPSRDRGEDREGQGGGQQKGRRKEKLHGALIFPRFCAANDLFFGQGFDAGELFAFEEFEAGSAAGGDVGDLVGDAGLADGRD